MKTMQSQTEREEENTTESCDSVSQGVITDTNKGDRTTRKGGIAVVKIERLDHNIVVKRPGPKSKTASSQQAAGSSITAERIGQGKEGENRTTQEEMECTESGAYYSDTDIDEVLRPQKKRKRGRPETTGAYREVKKERAERARREEEEDDMSILDPCFTLEDSRAMDRMKTKALKYMDDLRQAPNRDMTAEAFKHTNMLMRAVAISKKGLKGTTKAQMKEAASYLEATLVILNERATVRDTGEEDESVDRLKKQVRSLKTENQKLHMEMAQIRVQLTNLKREWPPPMSAAQALKGRRLPPPSEARKKVLHWLKSWMNQWRFKRKTP